MTSAYKSAANIPQKRLPYGRHLIDESDVEAVVAALKSDLLTTGPLVGKFESALADKVASHQALVCSNGTAALHLAALAFGLCPGKVAIVPSITFVATANAVRMTGADVVFADVDAGTGLMEAHHLAEALSRCPGRLADAVFPVHLAGQCADLPKLAQLARDNNLVIIEDACHAIGTTYDAGRGAPAIPIGACAHSDAACFSFHPVKTIAMGEGGAITTNDRMRADLMQRFRSHGLIREADRFTNPDSRGPDGNANPWSYEMQDWGYNYRVPDILCALGLSQLEKLDRFKQARASLVATYDELLRHAHPHIGLLARTACDPAWHLYIVLVDFRALGVDRGTVMRRLAAEGIGTQVHYYPVHRQPYYARRYGVAPLAGADRYYEGALSLPLFPGMSQGDIERVVSALLSALRL